MITSFQMRCHQIPFSTGRLLVLESSVHRVYRSPLSQGQLRVIRPTQIFFKLWLVVYKTIISGQLQYLKSVLIPEYYHCSTRSSVWLSLVTYKMRNVLGEQAFSNAFGMLYPLSLSSPQSIASFHFPLKTYLSHFARPS